MTRDSRWFRTCLFAAMLSGFAATQLLADDQIQVGEPDKKGDDNVSFVHEGKTFTATVTIKTIPTTATQKADLMQKAINAKLKAEGITGASAAASEDKVTLKGIEYGGSKADTGETDTSAFNPLPREGPVLAGIDFHLSPGFASLAGVNSSGGVATYTSGFTFSSATLGTVTLSAVLDFTQLTAPSVSSLLNQEFGIFQSQLQNQVAGLLGNLTLDLPNDRINLLLDIQGLEISQATITNGTTDVASFSTMSRTNGVPEPSSLLLASNGLLLALGIAWYRRRRSREVADQATHCEGSTAVRIIS